MPRLAFTALAFVLTLALSALAGPVPRATAAAGADPIPSQAFTFGPRPASDPLPKPTAKPSGIPLEMDWLS
ncbi:hypothetical protein OH77DRAFT_1521669 [Trametes cingulata]|nr:hypothetical protein OH77DRAFT_1521669 [Trametes cingulata]